MAKNRTNPVSARLLPEVKRALEKAAAANNRSVSSLIETILMEWLRERGYLKAR